MAWRLEQGDCLDVLKGLPANSVDSVVSDPPCGIHFMGKEWDSDKGGRDPWVAWMTSVMQECLRVVKPGGHILIWTIPRTSHWTATAIEDAGFEIREICCHLFGSGFPKSQNVGTFIDKLAGAEREVLETIPDRWAGKGNVYGRSTEVPKETANITAPATDAARQWDGWGTALKPAVEFWIMARKPLSESSIARNVLAHGTGAINVDACRVAREVGDVPGWHTSGANGSAGYRSEQCPDCVGGEPCETCGGTGWLKGTFVIHDMSAEEIQARCGGKGRFPPNLLLSHDATCGFEDGQCAPPYTQWHVETVLGGFTVDLVSAAPVFLVGFVDLITGYLRGSSHTGDRSACRIGVGADVRRALGSPGFLPGCPSCRRLSGELLRELEEGALVSVQRLGDALSLALDQLHSPSHSRLCLSDALHSSSDAVPESSNAWRKGESKTESSTHPCPAVGGETVERMSGTVSAERLPDVSHDNSGQSSRYADDMHETRCCTACRPAMLRTLCLVSVDLACQWGLPSLAIQFDSWTVNPCPVAEIDRQSGFSSEKRQAKFKPGQTTSRGLTMGTGWKDTVTQCHPDSGGASRFFPTFRYQPKPSRREREAGLDDLPTRTLNRVNPGGLEHEPRFAPIQVKNNHPCIKSKALMTWLITLVTRPGGTVLDPFAGSGSTGVAAVAHGFGFLGIEKDAAYCQIAAKRIAFAAAEADGQQSLFDEEER